MPVKIAVLGVIGSLDPKYSVASVIKSQIDLLLRKGHEVVFVTADDFDGLHLDASVEIRTFPRYTKEINEASPDPDFDFYAAAIARTLESYLRDCQACFTHDVIFIADYLPVAWAVHHASERLGNLRWFHWIHSAPSERPIDLPYPKLGRYTLPNNSELVYLNHTDIARVSKMFATPEASIRVVHNFVDPVEIFEFHPLSTEITRQHELCDADVIAVYPTRLVIPKQIDKIISLLGAVTKMGKSVRLVVCNSYSNAEAEKHYLQSLKQHAFNVGIPDTHCIFTSEFESAWAKENMYDISIGVPRKVVNDFFRLADVFILPSLSEACSLSLLEAAWNKNALILNEDLWSLFEFAGHRSDGACSDKAIYMSFGSVLRPITQYHPNEETWFEEAAVKLIQLTQADKSCNAFRHFRTHYNPDYIYRNQIEPMLVSLGKGENHK